MKVLFKKLVPEAQIPKRKHEGDACYDLVPVSYVYNPKYDRFEYHLGFATEFSSDWEAEIRPRSSNTKTEAYLPNSVGTIDSCYRGEWLVIYKLRSSFYQLFPNGDYDINISKIEKLAPYKIDGTPIAQVKFNRVEHTNWIEVDELSDSSRGEDGGLKRI